MMPPEKLKRQREEYQLAMQQQLDEPHIHRSRYLDTISAPAPSLSWPESDQGDHFKRFGTMQLSSLTPPSLAPQLPSASSLHGGAARPTSLATATAHHAAPATDSSSSPSPLHWPHDGGAAIFLSAVPIEVVRGDTGQRLQFYFQSTISYEWYHGNDFYRSSDGDGVGVELKETVRGAVLHGLSTPQTMVGPTIPASCLHHNEEAATADGRNGATSSLLPCSIAEARGSATHLAVDSDCGTLCCYQMTQVSRRQCPPVAPIDGDLASHCLGACTESLLIRVLTHCIEDEARLPDTPGWVYLYQGRHILVERGRELFMRDFIAQSSLEAEHRRPLTLCIFRKC